MAELSKTLPGQLKYVVQKLVRNDLSLQLNVRDFKRGIREVDRASNRLAFALIIAGLVIGSSVLTLTERGPHYFQVPILAVIGYLLAGMLGVVLLISILRSWRL